MNENTSQSIDAVAARLIELETRFLHLERTLGELDQAILAQQKRIDALERHLGGLQQVIHGLAPGPPEVRKPEDERPPHY